MLSFDRQFSLHIVGTNKLNEKIKAELTYLFPQLQPFIGKKIFLANGDKSSKFSVMALRFENATKENNYLRKHRCYLNEKYQQLRLDFSIHISENNEGVYFDREIEIGKIENGVLQSLDPLDKIIAEHGLDNVLDEAVERVNVAEYQKKQKEAKTAKKKINVPESIYQYIGD